MMHHAAMRAECRGAGGVAAPSPSWAILRAPCTGQGHGGLSSGRRLSVSGWHDALPVQSGTVRAVQVSRLPFSLGSCPHAVLWPAAPCAVLVCRAVPYAHAAQVSHFPLSVMFGLCVVFLFVCVACQLSLDGLLKRHAATAGTHAHPPPTRTGSGGASLGAANGGDAGKGAHDSGAAAEAATVAKSSAAAAAAVATRKTAGGKH